MGNESWFFAGLASSFTDLNPSPSTDNASTKQKVKLSTPVPLPCMLNSDDAINAESNHAQSQQQQSPVKIFQMPPFPSTLPPTELDPESALTSVGLSEQVLVFRHRGKFHAIDHQCPHRSYPLSKGSIYDIEDFGVVLSAGITCPKHGWAFDLHTGEADRGAYRLRVWEVEVRDGDGAEGSEVWIKKAERRRIG